MERTMKTLAADRAVSAEPALNTAIVNADITRGFEDYLALVDHYYAQDVEVSTETSPEPQVGKGQVQSVLPHWLLPLRMMADIGRVLTREALTPGDSMDDQHSEWSLELVGVIGRGVSTAWCVHRPMGTVACRF
jgi:hypothetical protein